MRAWQCPKNILSPHPWSQAEGKRHQGSEAAAAARKDVLTIPMHLDNRLN